MGEHWSTGLKCVTRYSITPVSSGEAKTVSCLRKRATGKVPARSRVCKLNLAL